MSGRTVIKCARVVALAALVGLAVAVPRPAVGAVGFRTFQHNAQRTAIGALLYIADADPPLIITAQELCRNEYTLLKTFLEDRGYVVYARATVGAGATGCAGLDGQIVMAASRGSQVNLLRGPFAHQAPDDGSERSYACVSATVYLLFWWGCSAHLTPNDVLSNVAQSNNMRDIASLINDRAVIVGGDFQRRPYEAGPKDWKPSFHEADEYDDSPTFDNDVSVYKKIDYIFSIKLRTDAGYGQARVGCGSATASHHCFIHGYHNFVP